MALTPASCIITLKLGLDSGCQSWLLLFRFSQNVQRGRRGLNNTMNSGPSCWPPPLSYGNRMCSRASQTAGFAPGTTAEALPQGNSEDTAAPPSPLPTWLRALERVLLSCPILGNWAALWSTVNHLHTDQLAAVLHDVRGNQNAMTQISPHQKSSQSFRGLGKGGSPLHSLLALNEDHYGVVNYSIFGKSPWHRE